MKTLYIIAITLLMGCANADATEPSKAPMTFGLGPVQDCVGGQCAMPTNTGYGLGLNSRTVNYAPVQQNVNYVSQQAVSYQSVPTTVMTTQMVEQKQMVPVQKTVTVMEEQTVCVPMQVEQTVNMCQQVNTCQQASSQCGTQMLPTSITKTRTRRVWFPRHRARVESRKATRAAKQTGC